MATFAEVQAAMTGFPRTLIWDNFRDVSTSLEPPLLAHTSATFALSSWSVHLAQGVYRVRGARVAVTLNAPGTWATPAAKASTDLRVHEQGHYDFTGLIARDLIRSVLNLSADASVVSVLRDAGNTPADHLRYVGRQFTADIARLGREANALLARLNTDPATGRDGLYDTQTNHGDTTAAQDAWNERLSRTKSGDVNFGLHLMLEGIS